jgi:hypothetical protein
VAAVAASVLFGWTLTAGGGAQQPLPGCDTDELAYLTVAGSLLSPAAGDLA